VSPVPQVLIAGQHSFNESMKTSSAVQFIRLFASHWLLALQICVALLQQALPQQISLPSALQVPVPHVIAQ
jgi:hypothetical protein